jgi:lactoylglutathione lyase
VPSALGGIHIHHITYSVSNIEYLAAWYVENLSFKLARRFSLNEGATKFAWLDLNGFRIGMIQSGELSNCELTEVATASQSLRQLGVRHVVFAVDSVDDTYAALRGRGVAVLEEPRSFNPPGIRIAYVRDPEGNVLGLYEDLNPENAIAE